MSNDETPPGPTFITSQPNRQQIEAARELCLAMLDKMHLLFWKSNDIAFRYEFWHADDEERKKPVHDRERMELLELLPSWATETLQAIAEINGLEKEAAEIVRPWGFFFDRFSGEVLSVGSKSYSNALLAILGVIRDLIHQMDHARDRIEVYDLRLPVWESTAAALAKGARYIWDARISLTGDDFRGAISYLQAHLRNQTAKALEAVDHAKRSRRTSRAKRTLLRKTKNRTTQVQSRREEGPVVEASEEALPTNQSTINRVELIDQKTAMIDGTKEKTINKAQYDVIRALIEARPTGLPKGSLQKQRTDARGILKRMCKRDPDWAEVIKMANIPYGRYCIL